MQPPCHSVSSYLVIKGTLIFTLPSRAKPSMRCVVKSVFMFSPLQKSEGACVPAPPLSTQQLSVSCHSQRLFSRSVWLLRVRYIHVATSSWRVHQHFITTVETNSSPSKQQVPTPIFIRPYSCCSGWDSVVRLAV